MVNMFKRLRDLVRTSNKELGIKNSRLLITPYNWLWMVERDPEAAEWALHLNAVLYSVAFPKVGPLGNKQFQACAVNNQKMGLIAAQGRKIWEEVAIKLPTRDPKGKKGPLGVAGAIPVLWSLAKQTEAFGRDRAQRELEALFSRNIRGDYDQALICVSKFKTKGWRDDVSALLSVMSAALPLLPAGMVSGVVKAMTDNRPVSFILAQARHGASEATKAVFDRNTKENEAGPAGDETAGDGKQSEGGADMSWSDIANKAEGAYKDGKAAYDKGKGVYDQVTGKNKGKGPVYTPPTLQAPTAGTPWGMIAAGVGAVVLVIVAVAAAVKA